ncbi:MAG: GGDEF domain-containing protein, partial [Polaromonas sp.]|nr:GGDEF domain-containing protein [Polaromonas sp.]
ISMTCIASHSQSAPKEIGPDISGCVAVSGHIADYFLNPGETGRIAAATEAAQSWLSLDSAALVEVIDIMGAEMSPVEALFEITIHHTKDISGILSQAKELLMMQSLVKMRELEDKSQRDGLTGAHNRSYFDDTIQREFILSTQHSLPLTIALIDLDHFKNVNDTYGHLVGDAVLIAVVRAIYGQIRQDDVLSRFGGEEFILILPGSTLASAEKLLTRIKNSIAEVRYKLDNQRFVTVTVSMGVAANMDGGMRFERPEDLIEAADLALYAAKQAGRNTIIEWNQSLPIK